MTPKPATCDPRQIERLLRDELDADERDSARNASERVPPLSRRVGTGGGGRRPLAGGQELLDDSLDEEVGRDGSPGLELDPESVEVDAVLAALGPTDDPRMLGRLGGYEIVGVIGRGGMGVVLKGFDTALNRYVAIKSARAAPGQERSGPTAVRPRGPGGGRGGARERGGDPRRRRNDGFPTS